MNLRIFQKFDPWGMNRLVWDKPETPPAPAAGPPTTQRTAEEEAAARAAMEKQRAGAAAAAQRTDRAGEQADAALDTALGGGGAASGQTPAAPTEAAERTTPPTLEELTETFKKYGDEYLALIQEKDPQKRSQKIAELLAKIPENEKAMLESVAESFLSITVKEQEDFRKKYFKDKKLNLDALTKANKTKTITDRERIVLLSVLTQADIDQLIEKGLPAEMAIYFAQIQSVLPELETRQKLARFDELVKDNKYAAAYKTFVENPDVKDLAVLKQEFLAVFKDQKDKEIVEWALTADPTAVERQFVLKQRLNGTKLTPKEIDAQVKAGKLNSREGHIALALIEEKDVDEWVKAGKIEDKDAEDLRAMIRSRAPETPGSEIPDSIKGLGIMGAIEKLIELLTKLANKISGAIDRMIKKNGPETQKKGFAKSPLGTDEKGEDRKFKLKRGYEKGNGVAIEAAPQAQIFAVEGGAVKVDGNVITVTPPQSNVRIEYRNVKVAAGVAGQTVEAGKPIGTAGEGGTVELRAFVNNEEQDTSELLKPYIQEEAAPAVAETPPATPPATTPPTAPATNPPNAPAQPPAAPAAVPAAKAEAAPSAAPQAPKKPWWKFWG